MSETLVLKDRVVQFSAFSLLMACYASNSDGATHLIVSNITISKACYIDML